MTQVDIPLLDDDISKLPSDIIEDLAERGRSSLYFFSKAIMGYTAMVPHVHGALCEFNDKNPARYKMELMPRDHFKTSCITISGGLQRICRDPEERLLIVNEVGLNAANMLGVIQQHAETNRVFRTLYSSLIPKNLRAVRWSGEAMDFNRRGYYPEPSISSLGMTGAMTSRHPTHVIFDDPISVEAVNSPAVMQDAIFRCNQVLSLLSHPTEDGFTLVGTRWAFNDLYSNFMENYGDQMALFIRSVIEDGKIIFPERFTHEHLALIRKTRGEYAYSCNYMNNPRNEDIQDFNLQDIRWFKWTNDEEHVVLLNRAGEIHDIVDVDKLDIYTSVDLAPAEKITSDRNAIVTCGITPRGDALTLDVFAERCSPLKVIEHLLFLNRRFHVRQFGIEGVAYQKAFKYFLTQEATRQNVHLTIRELTATGKKEVRIRGLQPVAATGHLYILPEQHVLRDELADFPLGKHDDVVDALAMQLQMWPQRVSPEHWAKYKESERKLLSRISGYSLVDPIDTKDPDESDPEDALYAAQPQWYDYTDDGGRR